MSAGGRARWEDLARHAARAQPATGIEAFRQFLTLTLDGTPYAVPVEMVREIVRMRPVTPIPRVCAEVCGVISLRGDIIQVIDLRRRLSLPAAAPGRHSRIIVLQADDDLRAGLLVDGVRDVVRVTDRDMLPPPGGDGGSVEALIRRDEIFVSVLDLERVLAVAADE